MRGDGNRCFFFLILFVSFLDFVYWLEWEIKKYFGHRSLKCIDSQVRLSSGHLYILLLRYKIWESWAKRLYWKPWEWIIYHQRSLSVESWALRCSEVRIWGRTSEEEGKRQPGRWEWNQQSLVPCKEPWYRGIRENGANGIPIPGDTQDEPDKPKVVTQRKTQS